MPTRGLNIKFNINGYKLGRKGGKITLIPSKTQNEPIIEKQKRVPPPPRRSEKKRKYYSESSSSEEYYEEESSDSEEEYYRRKEMKKHSRKPTNPRERIQKAAYRATQPGRTDLPPEKKMNKLNGRLKQLELAMNDVYNRFDQSQIQQQRYNEPQNDSRSDSSDSDSYSDSDD